jgi:adenine-specific DNA methylase
LSVIETGSVDLVLTDPPYFDNIPYSELSEFFLPWLELLRVVNDPGARRRITLEGITGRRNDEEATQQYLSSLSRAFKEIARVLSRRGLLVFSFRHTVPAAWLALAVALGKAPLRVTNFFPAPGEAGIGLHSHEGAGLWDVVFVLRRALKSRPKRQPIVSRAAQREVGCIVEKWASELSKSPLPFTAVDQLALRRAGYVAGTLGYGGHRRKCGGTPLDKLVLKAGTLDDAADR